MNLLGRHRASASLLYLGLALGPALAVADDPGARLEEIVVTARKREEQLIDVPVSIAVLTARDIEQKGIQNLYDVAMFTPGLTYFDALQNQLGTPVIRGLSQTNLASPDRNVAVFYGGVYLANQNTVNLELLDVERIEVVKGPQSALYGRNAFNGAINYVPARPTDAPFARVAATLGSDARREVRATVSGPITDTLRGRIAISYNGFDGSWENQAEPAAGLGGFETRNVSGALHWRPNEVFTARLFGYRTDDLRDSAAAYVEPAYNCGPAGRPRSAWCGEVRTPDTLAANPDALAFQRRVSLGSLELGYDFGPVRLEIQSAVFNANTDHFSDTGLGLDGGRGAVYDIVDVAVPTVVLRRQNVPAFIGTRKGETRARSHELRLEGGAGGGPLRWSVGTFLFENDFVTLGRLVYDGRGLAPGERPRTDIFLFINGNPTTGVAYQDPARNMVTLSRFVGRDDQHAWFGSFEFAPALQWSVGAELRRDVEDRRRVDTVAGPATAQEAEYAYITWRAYVDHALRPGQRLYASAAKGALSGYFNVVVDAGAGNAPVPPELQRYDPAQNRTYEIGWKAEWLDRRLDTELALFFIDYTGIQIPATPPAPLIANLVQNVGDATARGVELSVNFVATDQFQVGGTFSYTPTEFEAGTVDAGVLRYCGGTSSTIPEAARGFCPSRAFRGVVLPDVSGQPLPNAPNRLASLYASFDTPLGPRWTFFVRADASYVSDAAALTIGLTRIPARTLYNARLGLRRGPLDLALWSRNLTDRRYVTAVLFQPPLNQSNPAFLPNVTLGERRTLGLTATYSFGP
ncbi:MAG: TonB-dependent receptor [Steroidobacteraceae bacterium]|nr:TonB-dependent receptor [Steroidobacteraceae bacterium]